MRITKQILIDAGVGSVMEGNAEYFSVSDILKLMPDVKVDTTKLKSLTIDGKAQNGILAGDIHPKTDFDKKISQSLGFNPNKK